jgi:hypothetical protein
LRDGSDHRNWWVGRIQRRLAYKPGAGGCCAGRIRNRSGRRGGFGRAAARPWDSCILVSVQNNSHVDAYANMQVRNSGHIRGSKEPSSSHFASFLCISVWRIECKGAAPALEIAGIPPIYRAHSPSFAGGGHPRAHMTGPRARVKPASALLASPAARRGWERCIPKRRLLV